MERSGKRAGEGGGGNWTVLLFKVTASDDNVSKSLSPIVDCFVDWNISGTDIIIKTPKTSINFFFVIIRPRFNQTLNHIPFKFESSTSEPSPKKSTINKCMVDTIVS